MSRRARRERRRNTLHEVGDTLRVRVAPGALGHPHVTERLGIEEAL